MPLWPPLVATTVHSNLEQKCCYLFGKKLILFYLQTVSFYQLRAWSSPLCLPSSPPRYTENLSPWTWESGGHGRNQVHLFTAAWTLSLNWWCQPNRKALTCSPWLCAWSHQQLSWREWHWKVRCHCLHRADFKKTQCQLFSTHIIILKVISQILIKCLKMLVIIWNRHKNIAHFVERGTTISASVSYVFCQSVYEALKGKKKHETMSNQSTFVV